MHKVGVFVQLIYNVRLELVELQRLESVFMQMRTILQYLALMQIKWSYIVLYCKFYLMSN